ncbi:MAG TPA: phosphoribosylformylglycinamidine cyclo-ligase [Thermomicrobiaceae bacterium]|nr:phosphoribosylformylglycinamidine cyclo-ligase [Thermomicrobiaceae bacterium]
MTHDSDAATTNTKTSPRPSASYRDSGVDISVGDRAKRRIAERIRATHGPEVIHGAGLFGGFFELSPSDSPLVLVSSADSVGTKVLLAAMLGAERGLGIDLVNHCVNDILACGARPLFFLDYFATSSFDPEQLAEVVDGLTEACQAAGCALVGGETAQLPGIYQEDAFDLAGFVVGQVRRDRLIDGSAIAAGDVVIGLPSNGLHTNGYSLARPALGIDAPTEEAFQRLGSTPDWSDRTLGELLAAPHRSYLPVVEPLLGDPSIHGLAHITGGGLADNISRVIPDGLEAAIDITAWDVPPLFRYIQETGNIDLGEMYRVFNMGIGFVLIVPAEAGGSMLSRLDGARAIGTIQRAREPGPKAKLVGLGAAEGDPT